MSIQRMARFGGMGLITLVIGAALIVAYGLTTVSVGGEIDRKNQQANTLTADILPPPQYLVESFLEARLLARNPQNFDLHAGRLETMENDWRTGAEGWADSDLDAGLKASLADTVQNDGTVFWKEVNEVLKPAVRRNDQETINRTLRNLQTIFARHRDNINQLVSQTAAYKTELNSSSEATIRNQYIMLTITGLLLIAAIIAAFILTSRKLLVPLSNTAETMKQMAAGNLDVGVTANHREDEIGTMTQAIEVFREASRAQRDNARKQEEVVQNLSTALDRLAAGDFSYRIDQQMDEDYEALRQAYNSSIDHLAQMIGQVRESANSVNTGSNEIRAASDDLATRNEQQAASLEETAAAMTQVTELVKKSASNAAEAQSSMTETHKQASDGGAVVQRAVEAMSSIEKSSQEITQIIDVIDGIAFQTNLLALNAGVEAARAGDAGKGFAVVANEVRALAQRSADAARDIKELISNSTQHVGDGVNLVGETGELLQAIVNRVGEVSQQVHDIAEMAATQATSLEQVNNSVSDMDRMTQQNAAMVEESTAAARSLADEAGELGRLVDQFQISASAGGATPATSTPEQEPVRFVSNKAASRAAPQTSGNLALKPDYDEQDWSEF